MLPDFLKTKEKLRRKLDYTLKHAILSHIVPIDDIPESISFEGNKTVTIYEDGSVSKTDPKDIDVKLEAKSADVETEVPTLFRATNSVKLRQVLPLKFGRSQIP